MKKFVHVLDERKAQILIDAGFKCKIENIGDREVWTFIENDDLFHVLKDRRNFSKKDYFYSNVMKF